jgi:succinylglutamic semialdehyde dehydrogenase
VPALALGNTVIFKPSEKSAEVGELIATCMHEAGFPPDVFNMVQGDGAIAAALVAHPSVDAVMFTGSTAVGKRILHASAEFPGRMIALELGGRNPALVLADADLRHAASEIAFSAFVTAGQRCTANSRLIVHQSVADDLIGRLVHAAKHVQVGLPDGVDTFLGPVIDAASKSRALALVLSESRHFEALVPLAPADLPGSYLRPGIYLRKSSAASALASGEIFAPLLTIEVVQSEEEALQVANDTPYGLAAAVFTREETNFRRIADELDVGLCNWNRASVGSSSSLPFGGRKASGNHRPAGLFSSLYCADLTAELHVPSPPSVAQAFPGLRLP